MTRGDQARHPAFDTVGKFLNIGLAMLAGVDRVVELAATQFFGGHHVITTPTCAYCEILVRFSQ